MHATACTILADIRIRESLDEVARLQLSQSARIGNPITTGSLAWFRSQWRASAARALPQLAFFARTPRKSRRAALSS
jgi:hypothetical protein